MQTFRGQTLRCWDAQEDVQVVYGFLSSMLLELNQVTCYRSGPKGQTFSPVKPENRVKFELPSSTEVVGICRGERSLVRGIREAGSDLSLKPRKIHAQSVMLQM